MGWRLPDVRLRARAFGVVGVAAGLALSGLVVAGDAAPAAAAPVCSRAASVYGVLADGRMTYSEINATTGQRTKTLTGSRNLGFVPQAMTALNFNTLLATSSGGQLYRIDIITNNTSLGYNAPVQIDDGGWTHRVLAYDGHGHLYGIAGSTLLQYLVSQPKPSGVPAHIGQRVEIGTGFGTIRAITATGKDRLLANTTTDGALIDYRIAGGTWYRSTLKTSTWGVFDHLLSPGGGVYLARNPSSGAMYHYIDNDPFNGSGSDIRGAVTVDTRGWVQSRLAAVPTTCTVTPYRYVLPHSAIARSELDDPHHDYPAIDIPVGTGTPVYAVTNGTAYHIGGGYGYGVDLRGDDGVRYIFGHFNSRSVGNGVRVSAGQLIGYSGNTGNSTGPHLHFEIRVSEVRRCPQQLLLALYDGTSVPNPATLPSTGCYYFGILSTDPRMDW